MSTEYVVLSTGFGSDFKEAGPTHLTRPVGKLAPAALEDTLGRLSTCQLEQGADSFVPRLEIQTSGKNFTVHLSGGTLLLASEGKPVNEAQPATPAEIIRAVTGTASPSERAERRAASTERAAGRKRTAVRVAFAAVVATVLLQAVLVMSGYYRIVDSLSYDEITDAKLLSKLVESHVGVYANDDLEDGFILAVCGDSKLRFYEAEEQAGSAPPVYTLFDEADYVFGRMKGKTVIVEEEAVAIEIGRGGLVYEELMLARVDIDPDTLRESGASEEADR